MNPDLDTLVTTLYVKVDDLLIANPEWAPARPATGIAPRLSDAELVTLAVLQALLGLGSEARFIRWATAHLGPWFQYLPQRPGHNKRLRRSVDLMRHAMSALARDCPSYHDDVWLVDSTPLECGRSRETAKRSDLAGWASYGYCASRYFWGLDCHSNPGGTADRAGAHRRQRRRARHLDMIADARIARPGQVLVADKGYRRASFEAELAAAGITLIRPATKSEPPRPHQRFLRPLRQTIESINQTLKAQPGLEGHRPHPPRRRRARAATTPRAHRRHLAQPNHPTTRPRPITHRL